MQRERRAVGAASQGAPSLTSPEGPVEPQLPQPHGVGGGRDDTPDSRLPAGGGAFNVLPVDTTPPEVPSSAFLRRGRGRGVGDGIVESFGDMKKVIVELY